MKTFTIWMILILCGLMLTACGAQPAVPAVTPTAAATSTPEPTGTPVPSATPEPTGTPVPSATAEPSATPRATITTQPPPAMPTTIMESVSQPVPVSVPLGGFTFMILSDFRANINKASVTLTDSIAKVSMLFSNESDVPATTPVATIIDLNLKSIFSQPNESYATARPRAVTMDGSAGQMVDVTGSYTGMPVSGSAVAVVTPAGQVIFGLGIAVDDPDGAKWAKSGQTAFEMVVKTLRFMPVGPGKCAITTDKTYGYTKTNAVKVGGSIFSGPVREHGFLDNLRGPQGETVTYTRQGSGSGSGGVILDIYTLTYAGLAEPLTLYIDMYNFTPPFAPVGFTCAGMFTISAP